MIFFTWYISHTFNLCP